MLNVRQISARMTQLATTVVLGGVIATAYPARAEDFTAGTVITTMKPEDRYPFISGIVEGLAYARFVADGKTEAPGMACIYRWFYEEDGTVDNIFAAFARFPDHLPGAVVGALITRRCG